MALYKEQIKEKVNLFELFDISANIEQDAPPKKRKKSVWWERNEDAETENDEMIDHRLEMKKKEAENQEVRSRAKTSCSTVSNTSTRTTRSDKAMRLW